MCLNLNLEIKFEPMKNVYTVIYTINSFAKKCSSIVCVDKLFGRKEKEYEIIYDYLDKLLIEPDDKIIKNILQKSMANGEQ